MNSEYLTFHRTDDGTRKTKTWDVRSRQRGNRLGVIKWYGAWRQYTFWPEPQTIWNRGCLQDVQDFIAYEMEARKAYRGAKAL